MLNLKRLKAFIYLKSNKKIFIESQIKEDIDNLLSSYVNAAVSKDGALMLAVIGGKFYEGLTYI